MDLLHKTYGLLGDAYAAVIHAKYQYRLETDYPVTYKMLQETGDKILDALVLVNNQIKNKESKVT